MAKIMTFRPPDNLSKIIKREAKGKGYTLNHLMLEVFWDWANKLEAKEKETEKRT